MGGQIIAQSIIFLKYYFYADLSWLTRELKCIGKRLLSARRVNLEMELLLKMGNNLRLKRARTIEWGRRLFFVKKLWCEEIFIEKKGGKNSLREKRGRKKIGAKSYQIKLDRSLKQNVSKKVRFLQNAESNKTKWNIIPCPRRKIYRVQK